MSRKNARRFLVRRSKPKNTLRRPVNTQLGMLVINLGHGPAGTPADIAKTLDREWFRSHPLRSHRLRRAITGEFPEGSAETLVAVRQLQPGARVRLPFYAQAQLPSDEAPEHIAHAIYDLVAESQGRPISSQELFQRSRAYEVARDPEDPSHDAPLYRH
jgi:hypothetical protein